MFANFQNRVRSRLLGFRREEDGGLIIFSLFIFVLMLMAGGMAVDFMRFESHRVRLQGTLDRAVLAAADMDQTRPAIEVVRDYFDKAGLPATLNDSDIQVENLLGVRRVRATATLNVSSMFLRLMGHDQLTAPASAMAEEVVPHIEVSMVLDVSGSMASGSSPTRGIDYLREASETFVTMLIPEEQDAPDALTSISVVPYSLSVNLGARLEQEFPLTNEHDFSACVEFATTDFNTLSFAPGTNFNQFAHFSQRDPLEDHPDYTNNRKRVIDPFCRRLVPGAIHPGSTTDTYSDAAPVPASGSTSGSNGCAPDVAGVQPADATESPRAYETNAVTPFLVDRCELIRVINRLDPDGGTAIDDGLRWGMALLGTDMAPLSQNLINSGDLFLPSDPGSEAIPRAFNPSNVSKAMVLMTDGKMDAEVYINEVFQNGWSNVWYDEASDSHSLLLRGPAIERIADPGSGHNNYDDDRSHKWYHVEGDVYHSYPDTNAGSGFPDCRVGDLDGDGADGDDARECLADEGLERLRHTDITDRWDFEDIWSTVYSSAYFDYDDSARRMHYNEAILYYRTSQFTTTNAARETRLLGLCQLAKDQGITIFAVAINSGTSSAPTTATLNMLETCSSGGEYFFYIDGSDLNSTFGTIARRITALRLAR